MYLKTKDYCKIMVAAVWLDIMEKIENKWYILISLEGKLCQSPKRNYIIWLRTCLVDEIIFGKQEIDLH